MDVTADELAGVVDLFGGLTRAELSRALAELAYRQGEEYDTDAYDRRIDDALQSYHLVRFDDDAVETDGELLCSGPLAFPALPPDARDLPHILDVEARELDTGALGERVADRFRQDACDAIDTADDERIETLLDTSYELEAWASVDLTAVRDELAESTPTN